MARGRKLRLLAMLVASVPFAFALIRFFNTGSDLRALWMAMASLLGAVVVMALGRAGNRGPNAVLALAAAAFLIATLAAGAAAMLLGATAAFGIWAVASAFGLCSAAGCALDARSRG